jgi:ATP-binding cassette subfamily B protein
MKELLRLRKYLSNYRTPVLLGIASVVLTKLFQLAVPWLTGLAVGNIDSQRRSLTFVSYCVAAIVAVVLAEGFTEFIWRRKLIPVFHRVAFHLRNDLYQHLLKLSFSWFNTMKTGDIMSRTANDIQTIRGVIEFGIANMLRNIVLFVGATILMFFISVQLTLLTLMSLLIITVAIKFLGPRMFRLSMVVQERIATISAHAQENFSGIRVVKAFAVEEIESKKFDSLSREYVDSSMDLARLRAFMMPLFMTVAQIGILVTLWFGGRDIIFAEFDLGKFVAFVGYQQMMLWPMASFGFILTFLQRGAASMARINRILNEEPEIRDDHRTGEDVQLRGDIEASL